MLSSLMPDNFEMLHVPRVSREGGVGIIYNKQFNAKMDASLNFSSFECQTVLMDPSSFTFRFIIIYRIPPFDKNKLLKYTFVNELGDLLEATATLNGKLVLLGNFNVHLDSSNDPESNQLTSLLKSFDMVQHVRGATHIDGHTLALVVSRVTDDVVQGCEVGDFISEHNAIFLALKSSKSHPVRKVTKFRKIKSIVLLEFVNDFQSSELSQPLPSHVDDIVALYNAVLRMKLDKHAAVRTRSISQRKPQPWINKAMPEAKRIRRQRERRWKKSTIATCRTSYKESCEEAKKKIQEANSTYFIK